MATHGSDHAIMAVQANQAAVGPMRLREEAAGDDGKLGVRVMEV